jgi:phosphatidyl-myo-inositol alpha-mannosyltransferase
VTFVGKAVGIPANGSVAPICFGPVAAIRIRRELAQFHPDVAHLHEPLIPSLSLLALVCTRAPAVGTFHAAAPSSLLYRLAAPLLRPMWRRLAARTAVSDAAKRLVSRYFAGSMLLTPNGVDTARFAAAELIDVGPGPRVLFLGRLEPRKGADVAVRAMASIRDVGATLVVAGEGAMRARLEAMADELELDVMFLGEVAERDKARLFHSCDVYCAPNLGGESFGIVLVEAMASGCALVCSDLDEFKKVAGDAALFAHRGDAAALGEALRSVLTDQDRRRGLETMALARAALFDWSRIVPEVEDVYERARAGVR